MFNKKADIGTPGRDKLVAGANYIANAVKTTLGPGGQNFAVEKGNRVTNDGITIAKELLGSLKDETEDRGARILVDNATKVNDEAGDASTTFMVLTQATIKEAQRYLPSKDRIVGKLSPMALKNQLDTEAGEVIEKLKELAKPVESEEEMVQIATVPVEDAKLGELIGKTQWELGPEGYILAEETTEKESSIEKMDGLLLDNGFGSSNVINNPEKEALEVRNVSVIYTNHTITINEFTTGENKPASALLGVIQSLIQRGQKDMVIMSRGFTNEAIQWCLNQQQAGVNIYPLNAPYTDQSEVMYDLQAVLGGRFINSESLSLEDLQLSDVGFASHILAKRFSTVLAGGKNDVSDRIKVLEEKHEGAGSNFEKNTIKKRIAQLKNGFAVLKVGGKTDVERKYLKDKADDAVSSVRCALQEGTVKGGGLALYEIAEKMDDTKILKNPLQSVHLQLKTNAGEDFVVEDWVRDSVKILRIVLERAVSTAGVLSTAAGAVSAKFPGDLEEVFKK